MTETTAISELRRVLRQFAELDSRGVFRGDPRARTAALLAIQPYLGRAIDEDPMLTADIITRPWGRL